MERDPTKWAWWRIDAAGAAVVVSLSLLTWFAGVRPVLREHGERRRDHAELSVQREKAARLASTRGALEELLARTREDLDANPLRLKPVGQVNQQVAEVTGLGNECGLAIDRVQPGKTTRHERYETVPVRLTGSGTYKTCTWFLHRLRETFRDMGVRKLELTGDSPVTQGAARYRFDLVWYAALTLEATEAIDK